VAPSSEVPGPRNTQILRLTFPISTSISSIGHTHCTVSWRSEVPGPRNTSRYASYVLPINAIVTGAPCFTLGCGTAQRCTKGPPVQPIQLATFPIGSISHWRAPCFTLGCGSASYIPNIIRTFLPIWTLYPVFSSVGHRPLLARPPPISRTLTSY